MFKTRFISMLLLLMTAATGAWADTTITWGSAELSSLTDDQLLAGATKTVKGITVTVNAGTNNFIAVSPVGTGFTATNDNAFTFSTELGNFTKIECTSVYLSGTLGNGWDGATWTGDANSVNMSNAGSFLAVSSITFTIGEPAGPVTYKVTLKDGTVDADKWTVKVGEGQAQAFPVEGLEGGEQITVAFSGMKKVKSVKAVKKASAEPAGPTTVTWDFSVLSGTAGTGYENGGVKLEACDGEISFVNNQLDAWGNGITITNTLGKKFTSIVIYGEPNSIGINGGGWSNAEDNSSATWTGNSESVHIEEASTAMGITSIVFTLEDAPAPAEGKTYTNLQGGEVLHVGDKITETEGKFRYTHHSNPQSTDYYTYIRSFNTYEVLRANVVYEDYNYKYTESPDGQYYVLKHTYYDDYEEEWFTAYYFNQDLPVTGTSDGITVTLDGQDGSQRNLYTFWVHEPNQ